MKKLIITEKPSVARDFVSTLEPGAEKKKGYYEGDNYIVTWCLGHLITLCYPEAYGEEYKKWSLETLPFIPKAYKYKLIDDDGIRAQYHAIKECLNRDDIDTIYYAGDAAREGEYIQRLIRQMAGRNKNAEERRVWIDSTTKEEISRGVREAKLLSDYNLMSDAGYMRAIEDYLIGINFSRALSVKYGNKFNRYINTPDSKYVPLSVGRVMTCVLGLIVNRERLIRNAVEIPFYGIRADIGNENVDIKWKAVKGSRYFESPLLYNDTSFANERDAQELCGIFSGNGKLQVSKKKVDKETKAAPLLYNLAELQNDCSRRFKISPDETLAVIQSLYDKKLATYPRTDARVLSTAIAKEIENNLHGLTSLPDVGEVAKDVIASGTPKTIADNKRYTDDSKISDHYAIIPTGKTDGFYTLADIEKKVYLMIVKRFLAIFMPKAEYEKVSITFTCENEEFNTSAKAMTVQGFMSLYKEEEEDSEAFTFLKTEIAEGQVYGSTFLVTKGKTSAPKRYDSGSIILAMENAGNLIEEEELRAQIKGSGIGTSATRAEVLKKLVTNKYILLDKKTQILSPSVSGEILFEIVNASMPSLLSPKMTANWEKGLTSIVEGQVTKAEYEQKMDEYIQKEMAKLKDTDVFKEIDSQISELRKVYKGIGDPNAAPAQGKHSTKLVCPVCKKPMAKFEWGYGCSGYREGCKFSVSRKQYGGKLTDAQIESLIEKGETPGKVKLHSESKNKDYEAKLTLGKEGETYRVKVKFD